MTYETSTQGTGLRRLRLSLILMAALGMLTAFAFSASNAKADPVQMKFETGTINLGGEDGTWAKLIDPDLEPPDSPALIDADYDTGTGDFTAPKENFVFPPKRIEGLVTGNSFLPVVDAKIDIKGDGDITGNFDPATGAANVSVPVYVLIDVYQTGSPVSSAKCSVSGFSLELSTTGNLSDPGAPAEPGPPPTPARPPAEYDAAPFVGFPGVDHAGAPGALIAEWASLPSSEVVSGGLATQVCPALDGMLGGPGGVFMDGSATDTGVEPPKAPELAPKITASPAATTKDTTAKFDFIKGDGEPQSVTGFDCKIDSTDWAPCNDGTKTYAGQTEGSHTFHVRATNDIGPGTQEATKTWTIEGSGPDVCPPGTTGTPPDCVEKPDKPKPGKLGALKIKPKVKAIKRGKKGTFKVRVKNAGGHRKTAKKVKVCVKAPKKFIKVKKCVKVGNLDAGKSKTVKFKVTVKKRAKKGKRIALKFKATSKNAGKKSGRATVKVK